MPRLPGLRIEGIKILKIQRGSVNQALQDVTMDDDMRREISATALEDFATLLTLLQINYGLVAHLGHTQKEFAYHWHDANGACHADDTHDGFSNIAEAICAGIEELLFVERLNGMGPLVMALSQAGIDIGSVVFGLNGEEDNFKKVKELTKALRTAIRMIVESGREQPTGFQGPVVASFLTVARDIVRTSGADAAAAMGANQLPITAALPPGHVAVPAISVLLLEQALDMIDQTDGGPQDDDDKRSRVASAA